MYLVIPVQRDDNHYKASGINAKYHEKCVSNYNIINTNYLPEENHNLAGNFIHLQGYCDSPADFKRKLKQNNLKKKEKDNTIAKEKTYQQISNREMNEQERPSVPVPFQKSFPHQVI